MPDKLRAASVHDEAQQKLYVFKFRDEWLVVDIPAGVVMERRPSWGEALEAAQVILDAAKPRSKPMSARLAKAITAILRAQAAAAKMTRDEFELRA